MPYKCPRGKWTIGVGRNFEDNPLTAEERVACPDYKRGITYNGALFLLRNDIKRCYKELNTFGWFKELDDERKYALIDMDFQLGFKKLKAFRKMIAALKEKNYEEAAHQCLSSAYAQQTPNRAKRIAYLIKTGVWRDR